MSCSIKFIMNCGFGVLAVSAMAHAGDRKWQSGADAAHVVELYSSEGCSSCPPADSWLSGLKSYPGLWKQVIPVEFHVDYWNYLGWKDPLSNPAFSARQREYSARWRTSSVYTPGVVLDGHEWRDWSGKSALSQRRSNVGILSVVQGTAPQNYVAEFTPSKQDSQDSYEVYAVLLGNGLVSDIKSGENSGRALSHDFVALSFQHSLMARDGTHYKGTLKLDETRLKPRSLSVAFWVVKRGELEPIQAVGGDL